MLNIFKKPKKSSSLTNKEAYLEDSPNNGFLLTSTELREYITSHYPIEKNEWLATNTVNIYKILVEINSSVFAACTDETCPELTVGPTVIYWIDDKKHKNKLTASEYITLFISHVDKLMVSEDFIPTKLGVPFNPNFVQNIQKIYKMMASIFCHYFTSHFSHFVENGINEHLNTVFYHFLLISELYNLLELKDVESLDKLVKKWGFFTSTAP